MKGTIISPEKEFLNEEEIKGLQFVKNWPLDTPFTSKDAIGFQGLSEIEAIRSLSILRGMDLINELSKEQIKKDYSGTESWHTSKAKVYIVKDQSHFYNRLFSVSEIGSYTVHHLALAHLNPGNLWPLRPGVKREYEARFDQDGKIIWFGYPSFKPFIGKRVTITIELE